MLIHLRKISKTFEKFYGKTSRRLYLGNVGMTLHMNSVFNVFIFTHFECHLKVSNSDWDQGHFMVSYCILM